MTRDEEALLRAVARDPDDPGARLAYADLCEEQGRDARAALIRGQCLLEKALAPWPGDSGSEAEEAGEHALYQEPRWLLPQTLAQGLREDILAPLLPQAQELVS